MILDHLILQYHFYFFFLVVSTQLEIFYIFPSTRAMY